MQLGVRVCAHLVRKIQENEMFFLSWNFYLRKTANFKNELIPNFKVISKCEFTI